MDKNIKLEDIKNRFYYNSKTGELWYHLKTKSKLVSSYYKNGRLRVGIDGATYLAHRICWLLYYGQFPDNEIDHINGIPDDNRICNLRDATHQQNMCNQKSHHKNNKLNMKGVCFYKRYGTYHSAIQHKNKRISLGYFYTAEEAKRIYDKKAIELFGEYNGGHHR